MSISVRNDLVLENLPLVGYLVSDLCSRATHLSREDLASVGAIALIQAADAFDPELGVPFGAYARRRIVGALADDMRSADWASRGTRRRIRELQGVRESLTASLGRAPSVDELAATLGVDRSSVASTLEDADRSVTSLDGGGEDTATLMDVLASHEISPEDALLVEERTHFLRHAVACLPERMAFIVTQIYFEDRSVKDIAAELGLTHSAVSQQRAEAMRLLRDGIESHYAAETVIDEVPQHSRVARRRRDDYLAALAARAVGGATRAAAVATEQVDAVVALGREAGAVASVAARRAGAAAAAARWQAEAVVAPVEKVLA
ncbi:sigma-70 family RNA polymerase sigma factor [Georgenia sp. AZ-5]|uniref:sigma-70 family RNA polymerase sigma factor n=1 Tax=Georgenia sp. AZ-5 TaxID=3367526 RepID=UPI003753F9AB